MTIRRILLPIVLVLALVACSGENQASPGLPGQRINIDPEKYFEEYSRPRQGDGSVRSVEVEADASEGVGAPPPSPEPPTIDFHDDNTFVNYGENGFVATSDAPQSTFALDVDTGSIKVGRTFMEQAGTLPPADSVRIEEWVNALGSLQDAPSDSDLALALTATSSPFDSSGIMRVGVAGRDVAPEARPPANIVFVVDTSGSMNMQARLGLVKSSLALLVLNLNDGDTISVVTFDNEARVLLEPTPVEQAQTIVRAIDSLGPGGGTNLEAGLLQGYEQAASSFQEDGINVVVLASDGVANIGRTGPDELVAEVRDRADQGIHLVTVGYGMGNYNDALMEQLANQGDGFYAYVDTYAEAEQLFGDQLTSLLTIVAYDAKIQVEFDPAAVVEYRLLGYENRALSAEDFDDETVDAGEIGAGHRVVALYEVRFANDSAPNDTDPNASVGQVSLRYRSGVTAEQVTLTAPITVDLFGGDFATADPDLRLQVATATFADVLRGSAIADQRSLTVGDVHEMASAAAAQLPNDGFAGSTITPSGIVAMMQQARDLPTAPEQHPHCYADDRDC